MEVFVQKNYIKISLGISVLLFLICSKVLFKTKKSNLPHPPPAAPLSFTHHPRRFPHIFPTTHKTNFPQTPPRNSLTHRPRSFPRVPPTPPREIFRRLFFFSTKHKKNRICRTSTAAPARIHKPTAPQKYDKSDC